MTSALARIHWLGRRLRRVLMNVLLAAVILVAVLVAGISQLLPLLDTHPDAVAQWLSRRVGESVQLSGVNARWNRAGPRLALQGLRLGTAAEGLDIGQAELQINIYSGLWPGMPLSELRVVGSDLELRRQADGEWQLEGLARATGKTEDTASLRMLERLGAIDIVDARFRFNDAISGYHLELPRIDARLEHRDGNIRAGMVVRGQQSRLRIAAEMQPGLRNGTLYLEGLDQDWAQWAQAASLAGISLQRAQGDIRAWLEIIEGVPASVLLDTHFDSLILHGNSDDGEDSDPLVHAFSGWQSVLFWQNDGAGAWQLSLPSWQLENPDMDSPSSAAPSLDVARHLFVGRDITGLIQLEGEYLELGPVVQLLSLSPDLPVALAQWLQTAQPQARLQQVWMLWRGGDSYQFDAKLDNLRWQPAPEIPAIQGVSGNLSGDAQTARLQVQEGQWTLLAPGILRAPFVPHVSGEWVLYRSADGVHLETPRFHLKEDDYDIWLAGGVQFPEEGGALLDLRADVGTGPVVSAKRFWPVNVMPEAAVHWLDTALLGGEVSHGSALVRGNVRDWPFEQGEGRFEAIAELNDAQVLYHDDWLQGHGISGTARFINTRMELDLQGKVGSAEIVSAQGGIADFGDAILQLDIQGAGSGKALLNVLRKSPLQHSYGEYMQSVELAGQAKVAVALSIPLEEHLGEARVEGSVDIDRMDLQDHDWGLAFSAATGRVRFSDHGFSADELNVGFAGSVGSLTIAVGDYTSRTSHLAEASLRGRFQAEALIAASEHSQWLAPWFEGESDWTLQLTVPQTTDSAGVPSLRVRSDLMGTAIQLPAPLRKAPESSLPLDMVLGLPLETAPLSVKLGHLLHLQGQMKEGQGFSGRALFGEGTEAPMPERGLHVGGQIPALDLAAWSAVAETSGGGESLDLVSADIAAGELNLLGRRFRETRLQYQRDEEKHQIDLDGEALKGKILVPLHNLMQKGVTAQFQRLHWPESPTPDGVSTASQDTASSPFFPQLIPPLHVESTDTRFADAQLGSIWLETYPTADGLQVERLDTHSNAFDIKGKGEWHRQGNKEHTALTLDFSAQEAGGMLGALGFSRLLEGGALHGQLQLSWPEAPGGFDWALADGALEIQLGKGRILEVEPGAGRLFGLLSLTEIPRRLMLDFSDFFKSGFAFNQMGGQFRIEKGQAITDNFRIDGPAAGIVLKGRTGLKARDYDQTIEVLPKASSVLPALGALAGGPAGAAVGAMAQAVLREPLKEVTRTTYRVTGTWTEPVIDVIERETP